MYGEMMDYEKKYNEAIKKGGLNMTNAELIQKIKAEIERRMDKHWEGLPNADSPEDDWTHNELCELGAYKELEHLETFLSTLEDGASEKPNNHFPADLAEMAQSKSPLSVAYANRCFENGKQAMKEQMMKEAVGAEISYWNQTGLSILPDKSLERLGYNESARVRIIIVKEDGK